VLIAGPTASGKSALALDLACAIDGTVINTDSMQVYRDLRVLTARPAPEDEAQAPHRLYGHADAAVNYFGGDVGERCRLVLYEAREAGQVPILHWRLRAVFQGADPGVVSGADDPGAGSGGRARPAGAGRAGGAAPGSCPLRDPMSALKLKRAIAFASPARSRWWRRPDARCRIGTARDCRRCCRPTEPWRCFSRPTVPSFMGRIDARFAAMLEQGALDEVAALAAAETRSAAAGDEAHGVPALIKYLAGEISRDEAVTVGQTDTRPLCQAPIHLVPPPAARIPMARARRGARLACERVVDPRAQQRVLIGFSRAFSKRSGDRVRVKKNASRRGAIPY